MAINSYLVIVKKCLPDRPLLQSFSLSCCWRTT